VIIRETPRPKGTLGSTGVGEMCLVPTAPAVINAIKNAVGVYICDLPATPERCWPPLADRESLENVQGTHPAADAAGLGRHLRRVAGREIAFDQEGFFWDYDDWSGEAARELAADCGLA
jgi:hypothetical protein